MAYTKHLTLLLLLCAFSFRLSAQGFSFGDLFGQAKKQKQLYLQQIAAYQSFRSQLKQGYNVIKNGLGGISQIDLDEKNAHEARYRALSLVPDAVAKDPRVQAILDLSADINKSMANVTTTDPEHRAYLTRVVAAVRRDRILGLKELEALLTPGQYQLTDDERLKRLGILHLRVVSLYEFTWRFSASVKLMTLQRKQEMNGINNIKHTYEKN